MIQGGRYERQAGQHFNPYTYDDIKTIADHRHYVGANPHGGNGRSDSMGGGHAHSGLVSYQGGSWPKEYHGSLLMNNIHGARLNRDVLTPKGSGFVGNHAPDFLMANDAWSQVVNLRTGPDGSLFMIDWYDDNQCHRVEPEMHDGTNGRIFKVSYVGEGLSTSESPSNARPRPLSETGAEFKDLIRVSVEVVDGKPVFNSWQINSWRFRTALRRIQEGGISAENRALLSRIAIEGVPGGVNGHAVYGPADAPTHLRCLWALHVGGGLTEEDIGKALASDHTYVRAWAIQLACELRKPSAATLARMTELAKSDRSPVVRLYLASAAQRLDATNEARWAIIDALAQHAEDAEDHNLPLMVWYALEPLAGEQPSRALELASRAKLPRLLEFTVRRVGAIGTPEALAMMVDALNKGEGDKLTILRGINAALQGRRQVEMPESWPAAFDLAMKSDDAELRSQALTLALTFGDPRALEQLKNTLANRELSADRRVEALAALRKARPDFLPALLRSLLDDPPVRGLALRGLSDFDDAETPAAIVGAYAGLGTAEKRDAVSTLATRPLFAAALLDAVGSGEIPSKDLSADVIRQLRNLKDAKLDARINEVWGMARESTADKAKLIAEWKARLSSVPTQEPDALVGRAVFSRVCAQCHKLFATGSDIGPELTGSDRANLDYVLANVMDPSALIGKDYQAQLVAVADGRVLTGLVKSEDDNAITLVTANETVILPNDEIEERKLSDQSMMPEDLWNNLSDHEIRSLVAYLASPGQVPLLATAENAATFFNGKDLTGWTGNLDLWSVQDGEIVGKSPGIQHNEFLKSDLAAGDFVLTLKVKLTPNSENSGVQFRSAAQADGEVKGYQADAGQGWWGKLYEELGRGLLWDKSGEAHIKPNEWNDYRIEAKGSKIRTFLNGQPSVDLDDPAGAKRGIFAFQIHSGGSMEVRFKELKLEVLDPEPGPTTVQATDR
jgi:putative heme-binding domain-containing protein